MELLRIIAMSMILIHHFVVVGTPHKLMTEGLGFRNSFIFYGVNLFVLISGYYGIKVRWRSFLSLAITVVFFGLADVLFKCAIGWYLHGFNASDLLLFRTVLFRPTGMYWFISCYFILYFFAPVINIGLKNASKIQLRSIVLVALCYCLYAGVVHDYAVARGYEVPQFILLYITGYWIKVDNPFYKISSWWLIAIAISCSVINGSDIFKVIFGQYPGIYYSASYINLFCFVGSVVIFLMFTRISFHSRFINSLASASLGCYLLQESHAWYNYIYEFQNRFFLSHPLCESLLMYAASFVGLWAASWVLTWFKNLWAPKLIDAVYRALPRRWKQEVW